MRPYYNDPYTTEFLATVTSIRNEARGIVAVLDKSYFYPTSGGQEHDTGRIGDAEVIDVYEENGDILHLLSGEIGIGTVDCRIDRPRRVESMQQHTGQHILSAAFENLFDIATVSSRLGEYIGTIDLSRMPSPDEAAEAVDTANRIVREDRPVKLHYVEPGDFGLYKLRKPPKVEGTARIVEVQDFDMSPCGGTHCTHTSEVGVVLTGRVEKVKSGLTRIEFFCGNRAIRRFNEIHDSARQVSQLLSSSMDDVLQAVKKVKEQLQESEARTKAFRTMVLDTLSEKLAPEVDGDSSVLTCVDLSADLESTEDLRFVSSSVSRKTGHSFEFHRIEGNVCFMNLNIAASEDAAAAVVGELRSRFNAKGGGRSGFYSVTFDSSRLADVVAFVKESLGDGRS